MLAVYTGVTILENHLTAEHMHTLYITLQFSSLKIYATNLYMHTQRKYTQILTEPLFLISKKL